MSETPTTDPFGGNNPKAAAKAARAYQKAQRPFFKKKRFIIPAALVALIVVASALSGGSDDPSTAATDQPTTKTATTKTSKKADDKPKGDEGTKPSTDLPKQNGDWRLDTFSTKDDGLGDFGAVGRITYTGNDSDGGSNLFTVTVFDSTGKEIVATLQGSASDVKPGQTVTTQFFGTDKYKPGKLPFTFQNDL